MREAAARGVLMGAKNYTGVRLVKRGGKPRLLIDFRFVDKDGIKRRFKRDALVQMRDAAHAEAKRLMKNAAETGDPEGGAAHGKDDPLPITFRGFVEGQWTLDSMPLFKPSTRQRYRQILNAGLLEHLGEVPLAEVGLAQVRGYAARLQERSVHPKSAVDVVRSVLRSAHEVKLIASVPNLRGLYRRADKIPRIYGDVEIELLVAKTSGWLRTAVALGAYAGLRVGEVIALEVGDIDLNQGRLFVRRAMSGGEVSTTKSGKERAVPLAAPLVDILRGAMKDKLPLARVVLRETGTSPLRQNVYTALRKAQRKLELQPRSFHSLRHSFCTLLLRAGVHVDAVRRLAGHSDLATTQRYLHTSGDELQAAVAKLTHSR